MGHAVTGCIPPTTIWSLWFSISRTSVTRSGRRPCGELRPFQLGDNRVPVYYAGGDNIDDFRGAPGVRSGPEDWVGSTSALPAAILGSDFPADTGVSRLPHGESLRDAVSADPLGWLGPEHAAALGGDTALLVKLLDAGERLPVHCHPTRPFARRHLDSFFGKTEGWIIMRSAPGAGVWLGMRDTVERGDWRRWTSDQDVEAMLAAMNHFAVEPGDVVYVPAGLPHAIGPGVMLTELQEPTSFSVLAEHVAFGLDDDQATLGLGWDVAIDCFDLGGYGRRLDELLLPAAAGVRRWRCRATTLPRARRRVLPRRARHAARVNSPSATPGSPCSWWRAVAATCTGTAVSTRSPKDRRGWCPTAPARCRSPPPSCR